jgi:hypothetical protein
MNMAYKYSIRNEKVTWLAKNNGATNTCQLIASGGGRFDAVEEAVMLMHRTAGDSS